MNKQEDIDRAPDPNLIYRKEMVERVVLKVSIINFYASYLSSTIAPFQDNPQPLKVFNFTYWLNVYQ